LGLAIVQGIMLLHGGKVEISSALGQGTRVTLRLPVSGSELTETKIKKI
jgi:cell cycle sensor histidine kinase DivJ